MKEPLVSVIVITYNSSKYVLETLESTKVQTYKNIELIISDDGSTDDTIEICRNWLENNQQRFKYSKLITVEKNTGIPANCNRGVKASNGEWVKIIAGDDILKFKAISNYLRFVNNNENIQVLQSEVSHFNDTFEDKNFIASSDFKNHKFFYLPSKKQYRELLIRNRLSAPAVIFKKEVYSQVYGFDEEFKYIEDHPFYLKILSKGIKIWLTKDVNVGYRIHNKSVQKNSKPFVSAKFLDEAMLIFNKYRVKDLPVYYKIKIFLKIKLLIFLDKNGFNKRKWLNHKIYYIVNKLFQ